MKEIGFHGYEILATEIGALIMPHRVYTLTGFTYQMKILSEQLNNIVIQLNSQNKRSLFFLYYITLCHKLMLQAVVTLHNNIKVIASCSTKHYKQS